MSLFLLASFFLSACGRSSYQNGYVKRSYKHPHPAKQKKLNRVKVWWGL
ncbi:MAG: hypothetical protein ACFCUI_07840 [Bernardetiaceae bacterium]